MRKQAQDLACSSIVKVFVRDGSVKLVLRHGDGRELGVTMRPDEAVRISRSLAIAAKQAAVEIEGSK